MQLHEKSFLTLEETTNDTRSRWSAVRSALVADVLRSRRFGDARVLDNRVRVYGQIQGESMLPTVWPGDVVEIESCSPEDVQPGEIVLAQRDDRLVLHRLVTPCTPNGFLLRGDSVAGLDPFYPPEALLGRLVQSTRIRRKTSVSTLRRWSSQIWCSQIWGRQTWFSRAWFSVKWARAVGLLLCHCRVARRLALGLHCRMASASELLHLEARW
jgi:hypothetical protein